LGVGIGRETLKFRKEPCAKIKQSFQSPVATGLSGRSKDQKKVYKLHKKQCLTDFEACDLWQKTRFIVDAQVTGTNRKVTTAWSTEKDAVSIAYNPPKPA